MKKVCIFMPRHHTNFNRKAIIRLNSQAFLLPVLPIHRWYFFPAKAGQPCGCE